MRIEVKPSVYVDVAVQFEDPLWIGVVERHEAHEVARARVEFDHEPSEAEVREYVTTHYESLQFSPVGPGAALKGHEALKRLLEQRQHQNAIAARLNQAGSKQRFSGKPTHPKGRHRGVR